LKSIEKVIDGIDYNILGEPPNAISSIANNSKQVEKGSLFFAIKGTKTDGHKYITDAIDNGAAAIVVEEQQPDIDSAQILVDDSRKALSRAAKNFYDDPTRKLNVIGITGTNGKTSTVYILNRIASLSEIPAGTIGTLGYSILDEYHNCSLTTPDVIKLQNIFQQMVNKGVKTVFMEVSSHAIALHRVRDIHFQGVCFLNLSQDHLDFHETMDEYAATKARLFSMVDQKGFAICNIDSHYAQKFIDNCKANLLIFSLEKDADYIWQKVNSYHNTIDGLIKTPKSEIPINSKLSGKFNLQNILAAVAIADNLNIESKKIKNAFRKIKPVPGRIQEISLEQGPRVFIDYAHTPHAIINVLDELSELVTEDGRLITVYGCGGDRDRKKRPSMTEAVEKYSDLSVLTTDNPRFEKPEDITNDAKQGFSGKHNYKIIIDREKAINWSLKESNGNDIVAILGKGHETYQEIKGKRYPFSDFKVVRRWQEKNAN